MKIDFTKFPIGTKVWDMKHGWGKIIKNDIVSAYTVRVEFDNEYETFYTSQGKEHIDDVMPTLFLHSFEIPECAYKCPPIINLEIPLLSRIILMEKHDKTIITGQCVEVDFSDMSMTLRVIANNNEHFIKLREDDLTIDKIKKIEIVDF